MTNLNTAKETATSLGKGAVESVEELSRSATRTIDEACEGTGKALHTAASSVRSTGRQGSEAIDNLTMGTADRLDSVGKYVEDHDLSHFYASLRSFGRRHLTGSLVAAAVVGFFAGSAVRRATHSCSKSA